MMKQGVLLCLLVCTQFWVQGVYASINHAADLEWQTQESAHFRVHFYTGEVVLAAQSLKIAESVYDRLTPIFDWYPKEKTEIVLSDEMGVSNGSAIPIPSNRITLYVSRPKNVNSLEDHAGWLENLILHEFVHTLHLDKAKRGPKNIRNIFGRMFFAFPNVFMPAWMHEGLATYYETDNKLGIGRGQSTYFQMMMRMEVNAGLKPVRQINQLNTLWPMLTSRYLYGVYFYQFIADTYGEDTIQKLVESYSDHWLPFSINHLYEDVLGKDLSQVWDAFEVYANAKFQPQIDKLKQQGIVQGVALTQTGDFKQSVLQADDGRIFFVSDNLTNGAKLKQVHQGQSTTLLELNTGAKLDWHEQSGLLMTHLDICDNAKRFYDIYRVNEHTGQATQLTFCARYVFAAWSPDGSTIAAVKNERGHHALHLLDKQGKLLNILWQGKNDETLSGLDWSDDGRVLLSSVWRKGTGWDVEIFDIQSKKWAKLTNDMAIQTDARFVEASRKVLFSAEYDGVYNIYLRKVSGELLQLTHVLGGAFSPFLNKQGELLSVDYHAQGFDVVVLNKPLSKKVRFDAQITRFSHPQFPDKVVEISAPVPYSAWDSMLPTSWLPNFLLSDKGIEVGAFVFGLDVLNQHNYSLYAGYQSVSSSAVFNFDYIYDGWQPLLKIHAEKLQEPSFDKNNTLIALVERQRMDVELVFPWLKQQSRWTAHLALNHQRRELAWLESTYLATNTHFQDTLLGAALVYDTRLTYPRGISSASTGHVLSILVESGQGLGGNYTGKAVVLSGRQYWDLGGEQVLASRLDMGAGDNKARPFIVGGTTNANLIPNLIDPLPASTAFNQRQYSLRGYGSGALIGNEMVLASLEYRFPISHIEKGLMAPPLGIDKLFGQVFIDTARVDNNLNQATTYTGIGAELGGVAVLFYNLPIRMQLGYAKGLDDVLGGNQAYFRLGSSF